MVAKIKNINIHAFRGIPELEIDLSGKSLLVLGENGMGKSSIVDAIEFFFNGKINHLEGVQGLSSQKHGPHVNFELDDVEIGINFNPNNLFLNRTFSRNPEPPETIREYFETAQKGAFILRRKQLLEFITSIPSDRFQSISNIMGLESLDEVDLSMLHVRDNLKGKRKLENENCNKLLAQISTLSEEKINNVEDVLPALNKKLVLNKQVPITSFDVIKEYIEQMWKIVKSKDIDETRLYNDIIKETTTDIIYDDLNIKLAQFSENVTALLKQQIQQKLSMGSLLKIGKETLEYEQSDICPLCEQEINRESLLIEIETRLRTIQSLTTAASEIRTLSVEIIGLIDQTLSKLELVSSKVNLLSEMSENKNEIAQSIDYLIELKNKIQLASEFKGEISIQEFTEKNDAIKRLWSSISESSRKTVSLIGLSDEEKNTLSSVRLIESIKIRVDDLLKAKSQLQYYDNRYNISEKIYSTFLETKKSKIQEIYSSIQSEIDQFYSTLHPNDAHSDITLKIARRSSTNLKMKSFGGNEEDPRALISEGHLDSLGLCIFLAFVKKFNGNCSLLVLDDVVTTIDSQHRKNICELLHNQFNDFQLLITTHDQIWYDQLRASQRACGIDGNFKNITINNWSLENGPVISQYKPKWEKIQEKIDNNDKEGAGSASRYYLEWILKEAAQNIEASVKFKHSGLYTVGELFTPVKSRMNTLLYEGDFKTEYLQVLSDLESTVFMANLLSHDNSHTGNFSQIEVNDFCESVHNFHELLECPECKTFIKYYSELKILRCQNPRCKNPFEERTK
jgi:AAA15 family ATPase/GTPase